MEAPPTAPPLYIPTVEDPSVYQTVAVERTVLVEPPAPPMKDPTTIELEASLAEQFNPLSTMYTT